MIYIVTVCIITSCSSTRKLGSKYKKMNLSELKNEKDIVDKQLSYCKLEFYVENINKGKSRYSLATLKDKNLQSIMRESPNYQNLRKKWKQAVSLFIAFEDEYSPEIKKHRSLNYKNKEKSLTNRKEYNKIYLPLRKELKKREYKKYVYYEKNFSTKLGDMWYDGGKYLLNFYKSKNLKIPTNWLNDKDLFGIEYYSNYSELVEESKYINKEILKKR